MPDKKINELPALTDLAVNDDAKLFALGDGTSGQLFQVTVAQAKVLFGVLAHKYVALGSEGSTLTIAALQGKNILSILRESGPIYEVASAPDPSEYTWDDTDIVLGTAVGGAGERFLILYTNY